MNKLKTQNAITLIALVITIIVLLILAGISIAALTNQGLFAKANEAKQKMDDATINQAKILNEYEDELKKYIPGQSEEKLVDKVNDGNYGICSNCHKKIEQDRLDLIPETTLCATCAKEIDTSPDESESMDKNPLNSYNDMYYSEYIKDLTDLNKNDLDDYE